jgi:hypothetical protein
VDAYRREVDSRTQSRLTPDQVAKLDRLAELANANPEVLAAIQAKIDEEAKEAIWMLSTDELKALAQRTGLDA